MSAQWLENIARLLLRLSVGGLLFAHGLHKLNYGINGITRLVVAQGWPASLAWGVYVGELLAPLLVIAGAYARLGGALIAINMTMALYLAHRLQFWSFKNDGGLAIELQVMFLVGGLCVALLGAGRYSVMGEQGRWN